MCLNEHPLTHSYTHVHTRTCAPVCAGEAVGRLVKVEGLSPEAMDAACKGHDDDVVGAWAVMTCASAACGSKRQRW